ncbi:hypothetical protein FS837_007410 [Tulasnella sp. UAMH 9824]|nr:hypothetical protein FS837_007410 [Tulasnella sp. UAMH 9824]
MDIDQQISVSPALPTNSVSKLLSQTLEPSLFVTDSMSPLDDIEFAITSLSLILVKVNGHFCDVFEGTHVNAGKVALKRPRIDLTGYDDVIVRRFEREAATWRRLRHPHILEFLGTFERDGHMYRVSPFIENGTLVEYIAANPDINRIRLLCETADAVEYLHKNEVMHGDLKASNILIGDNGSSLLCKALGRSDGKARSFGTTPPNLLSRMSTPLVLTGRAPFSDLSNDMAVMYAVMLRDERPAKTPVVSSRGISCENTWNIAAACWPRNPDDRISMLEALHRIQTDPSLEGDYKS